MAIANPQTIYNDLIGEINTSLRQWQYLEVNSFEARRLFSKAKDLTQADAVSGWICKAAIHQLCCEPVEMRSCFGNALRLAGGHSTNVIVESAVALANLGFHTEAQDCYRQLEDPSSFAIEHIFSIGYQSFCFEHLNLLIERAQKMNLSLNDHPATLASKAHAILKSNNTSEKMLGQYADLAGDVLRENRLMSCDTAPNFIIADHEDNWSPATIFITFKVNAAPDVAAKLYKEFTRRLLIKFGDIPDAIHISIESVQ